MRFGVNACKIRGGGGLQHLQALLSFPQVVPSEIEVIHVWVRPEVASFLPKNDLVTVHVVPPQMVGQVGLAVWEKFSLGRHIRKYDCSALLNVDAGSLAQFNPFVTISQDALPFDLFEIARYGLSLRALRLVLLRVIQKRQLPKASAVIAQTPEHARSLEATCGPISKLFVIEHGVDEKFKIPSTRAQRQGGQAWPPTIKCLSVSAAEPYKNTASVIEAVARLRENSVAITLTILGSLEGPEGKQIRRKLGEVNSISPGAVTLRGSVAHADLLDAFDSHDLFIFASSCESQSLTLLEAMAREIPILCSNRSSMPQVLGHGGTYFDPFDLDSLANAILMVINNRKLARERAALARERAMRHSWPDSIRRTWEALLNSTYPVT